nr:tetratricopeptide repeat protein [uncultured Mucilaginibacter sp.]
MKYTLFALLLTTLSLTVSAQTKVDDALLLDYYQNQRFAEASDYLKTVYTEPVTDLKALSQLAYTSNMAGRLPEAEGYYQRIYDIDSTRSGVLFSLGSINLRRGNSAKAEVYYKRIAAKDSTNFIVYKQLAQISLDKGDIGSQIAYLQRANKINPADADAASDLANRYIELKLLPQAEKVLYKATAADPENIVLLESLMKLTYAQHKWAETVDACLKLLHNGNESSTIRTKLGVSYYNLKNYTCGAETFADIPSPVQNEFTYYYAAMCYKALKDNKQAIFLLEKAIKNGISPSISSYYGEIADSDEKLSRYKKAAIAYQKGLQCEESPMIYYSLANLYDAHLKDKKNALKYYKKYLASRPPEKEKNYIEYAKSRLK